MNNKWRNELVASLAEFCGTFMFLCMSAWAFSSHPESYNASQSFADSICHYSLRIWWHASRQHSSTVQRPSNGRPETKQHHTSTKHERSIVHQFDIWVQSHGDGVGVFQSQWRAVQSCSESAITRSFVPCDQHREPVLKEANINAQVTFGLYLIGALTPLRAFLCFIVQMLAGICAAAVVSAILPGPLNVSTTLGNDVTPAMGVFLEMFLTSLLVFTIFMLAAEKHKATFLAPIGIGLSLFVAEMVGVFFTGGSLNPTRSFGPCVVTREFPSYHYIYWFGPIMGTLLAFGVYRIVKIVEYETVNPGQDFDDHEAALFKPPEDAETADQVERPNVAAMAVEEAVRQANMTSTPSSTEKQDVEDQDGIDSRAVSREKSEIGEGGEMPRYVGERELLEQSGHTR
jgi:hypothetical protein